MKKILIVCLAVFFLNVLPASAESILYMDDGGNIYFAETIWEVPPRYRYQVRPSGTPMCKKEWKKLQKKIKAKKKEKKKKKKKKKKKNWAGF